MKANTTSSSIINWVCQQMIQVYKHACHHNQISFAPIFLKKEQADD